MNRPVDPFDLILLCPIRLGGSVDQDAAQRALGAGGWRAADLLTRNRSKSACADVDEDGFAFAELAYFHRFVRKFLYGDDDAQSSPLSLFRLEKGPVEIEVDDDWQDTYSVHNVWLYITANWDIAILVLDLSAKAPTTWNKALDAMCYLRTIHFQHYKPVTLDEATPRERRILRGGGAPVGIRISPLQKQSLKDLKEHTGGHKELMDSLQCRRPRLLPHWDELLTALRGNGMTIEPLGDHRMAVMGFLGTPDPFDISDDEWFALSEADGAGFNPYAPQFREKELANAVYDRWWNANRLLEQKPQQHDHRYLAGPMTFLSVKRVPSTGRLAYVERLRATWRRQQFQLFFIAHYQRSALLVLQDRIARATQNIGQVKDRRLLAEFKAIQRDVAVFSSRDWFTEVSPQVQGQDLYLLIKKQLSLDTLYRSVMDDKALLGNWVDANFWETINRFVIPAGLLLSFLGINVLIDPAKALLGKVLAANTWGVRSICCANPTVAELGRDALLTAGIAVLLYLSYLLWRWRRRFRKNSSSR